ncbi:50S ribosomal protein L13 [Candidatus Azambacteria bacterium]|nr:50S ribosomal protein L13 [Candidatus Azambacteria bacterium]
MIKRERTVYKIDANGKALGRLASEVAMLLRGKASADFQRHIDSKDIVHVFNVGEMKLTGDKLAQKKYYHYSGYPGGLKETKLEDVMEKDPGDALYRAVYGMLPKNKLRPLAMKRLFTHRKEIK